VKTPAEVVADVERRLKTTWTTNLERGLDSDPSWPQTFPLGAIAKVDLERDFDRYRTESLTLRSWAAQHGLKLTDRARLVVGTTQRIPTHVTVDDVDAAARLCGSAWTARLTRGRARLAALRAHRFAGDLVRIVRDVDGYSDLDFDLACSTAHWFRDHGETARGLTPRQVPVPGLQAKWLNTRRATIATLAGLPDLGLMAPHPPRIHFT
jgi:hypothetical protein